MSPKKDVTKDKHEAGTDNLSDEGSGVFASLGKLVAEVRNGPGAALLAFGLLILLAAFVTKIGSVEVGGRAGPIPTAIVGTAMCVAGVWLTRRTAQSVKGDYDPVVLDPAFMIRAFQEGMPPAFIKRVPSDGKIPASGLDHILQSEGLLQVQDETEDVSSKEPRFKEITADHIAGDKAVLEQGRSTLLELATFLARGDEIPILTFKTRIEHKGTKYIVGWYVPIDLDHWPSEDTINLKREVGTLPRFRLAKEPSKKEKCLVRVGSAIKAASHAGTTLGTSAKSS